MVTAQHYGVGIVIAAVVSGDTARIVLELGVLLLVLGAAARMAVALRIASAPLFLIVGLAFGDGGVVPIDFSEPLIGVFAEVGLILLLLFLGLEYSADTILFEVRTHRRTGLVDLVLNAVPGAVAGLMFGWDPLVVVAMAGVTYISSSGIATQVAREMGWRSRPEWKSLVAVLVLEDLVMAPYLPILSALGIATSLLLGLTGVAAGLLTVSILLFLGSRGIRVFSAVLKDDSGATLLLTTLGLALAVGGIAGLLNFSSAVAAFFIGLLITGEVADAIRNRLRPLRDVFAALFFVFFGLQTNLADIPSALVVGILLVAVTWVTKVGTVWFALGERRIPSEPGGDSNAGDASVGSNSTQRWFCALRGGSVLSARGEFSIAIGALIVAFDAAPAQWQGIVATYVILSAVAGPLLAKLFDARSKQ